MSGFKLWLWTAGCVGLGLFLGAFEIGRKTPFEHAQRAWQEHMEGDSVSTARTRFGEAVEDAHDRVVADEKRPRERHSDTDRKAVDRIIAKGASGRRR